MKLKIYFILLVICVKIFTRDYVIITRSNGTLLIFAARAGKSEGYIMSVPTPWIELLSDIIKKSKKLLRCS